MTIEEQRLQKLASKLDNDDMAVLGGLLQKVAADSANAGAQAAASQEDNLQKIATTLVEQGFSDEEIVQAVEKIAEEQKVAAECSGITQDCLAMGSLMGKQASQVVAGHADALAEYIGKKAAAVCIQNLQGYAKSASEDEDEDEEEKKDKGGSPPPFVASEKEEDDEEDKEKEASVQRNMVLLRTILEGTGYGA
jgi:Holliday junction resolvasome RuvABC DNA-binding subunit